MPFGKGKRGNEHGSISFEQWRAQLEKNVAAQTISSAVLLNDLAEMESARDSAAPSAGYFYGQMFRACQRVLEANDSGRVQPPLSEADRGWLQGKMDTYKSITPASQQVATVRPTDTSTIDTRGRKY